MKFLIHKRRTAPAIIVVALIDVLIVLVIFLLVTTTFKQPPALRLSLPESNSAQRSGTTENPPLLVNIEAGGALRYGQAADVVTPEQLQARLVADADKARAAGNEARLALRADKAAPWGQLVRVMDIAKAANIKVSSAYMKEAGKP